MEKPEKVLDDMKQSCNKKVQGLMDIHGFNIKSDEGEHTTYSDGVRPSPRPSDPPSLKTGFSHNMHLNMCTNVKDEHACFMKLDRLVLNFEFGCDSYRSEEMVQYREGIHLLQ
jgi:hypothetical protein